MHRGYSSVRDMARTCPLPLLHLKDKKLIDYANSLFPTSVGLEFETFLPTAFGMLDCSHAFPKTLLSINYNALEKELQVRVASGIQGMVDLYEVSNVLKKHAKFNKQSGIHYHINVGDFNLQSLICFLAEHEKKKALEQLISWNYKGIYNLPQLSSSKNSWIRIHPNYPTLEFRVGEMTFDYARLFKRATHAQKITTTIIEKVKKFA